MNLTIVTTSGSPISVAIEPNGNAESIYYAIYGRRFDPIFILTIYGDRILNPYESLHMQGVRDGGTLLFRRLRMQEEINSMKMQNTSKNSNRNILDNCNGSKKTCKIKRHVIHSEHKSNENTPFLKLVLNENPQISKNPSEHNLKFPTSEIGKEFEYGDYDCSDDYMNQDGNDYSDFSIDDSDEDLYYETREYAHLQALRKNDLRFDLYDFDLRTPEIDAKTLEEILEPQESHSPVKVLTAIPNKSKQISTQPLPVFWDNENSDEKHIKQDFLSDMIQNLSIVNDSQKPNRNGKSLPYPGEKWNW